MGGTGPLVDAVRGGPYLFEDEVRVGLVQVYELRYFALTGVVAFQPSVAKPGARGQ